MRRILVGFVCLFMVAAVAEAGGSHGAPVTNSAAFRVGNADVTLILSQPSKGGPRAQMRLAATGTSEPLLDADALILFEKMLLPTAASAPSSGRVPSTNPTKQPPGDTASGSGADEAPLLDFGNPEPEPVALDLSGFTPLRPTERAGEFAADAGLPAFGSYRYTIAFRSLGGRSFTEPRIVGGMIRWSDPARALRWRMSVVMGLMLVFLAGFVWVLSARSRLALPQGKSLNLLEVPWIRRFMLSAWFQPLFQIPTALFFAAIVYFGLADIQQGDRNISTILMWTIWWAAIIFTFVFVGRIWCMMCPYGAAQDLISRRLSLGKRFPKALRNIWLSTILFLLITWWDTWSGIVNKPALTAWLLIGFFAVAAAMALVFRGRSFCRYVCPIGGLIGIYSMFSPIELRNRCLDVCRKDKVKGCIRGTARNVPCPMFETPMTLDRNNYCNFCSECIKGCAEDNIVIRFRSFAKDLWVSARGYLDEAFLAMALTGLTVIVTAEMVEPWHRWMDAFGRWMPYAALGIHGHALQEKLSFSVLLVIGAVVVPMLLLALSSALVRRAAGGDSDMPVREIFIRFAYMFIPVGIGMHLAHNVSHLVKEGPLVVPALERLFYKIFGIGGPVENWNVAPLMGAESIYWLQMFILLLVNGASLYAGYRIAVRHFGDRALRAFVPMAVLAVSFMLINAWVLGQPMALRHTH